MEAAQKEVAALDEDSKAYWQDVLAVPLMGTLGLGWVVRGHHRWDAILRSTG